MQSHNQEYRTDAHQEINSSALSGSVPSSAPLDFNMNNMTTAATNASLMQQQGLLNTMLHPSLQQNTENQSISYQTFVTNYALQQQQQQQQNQQPQTSQDLFSVGMSNRQHLNIRPRSNSIQMSTNSIPISNETMMSQQQSIETSSINVSTASYEAPRPQNRARHPSSPRMLVHSSMENHSAVKLAAVPTRKLASRSIISLNLNPNLEKQSPSSVSSINTLNSQSQRNQAILELQQNSQQSVGGVSSTLGSSTSSFQALGNVNNRTSSSYSLACNATILAQQELSKDSEMSASQNHSEKVIQSSVTSTSILKRASPEPDHKDQPKHKYLKVIGGKPSISSPSSSGITLQKFLSNLLSSRGYSTQHYCSLEGGYYCKPTDLQKASYGMTLLKAIRTSDENLLERILKAGLSPNPCNAFGESTIHMVCRRGNHKLLKKFLDHGCSVQVSDDFGRTPLHDACWTTKPCFKSVELLLNKDLRLLHIVDCRGSSPLSYVKQENWGEWMEFLDAQKNVWWPHRSITEDGEELPPPLVSKAPHSIPLLDPPKAALCAHAKLIASGKVEPEAFSQDSSNVDKIEIVLTDHGDPSKQSTEKDESCPIVGRSSIAKQ